MPRHPKKTIKLNTLTGFYELKHAEEIVAILGVDKKGDGYFMQLNNDVKLLAGRVKNKS